MIDLKKLEKYKENNRIEAKKALGGLPGSIWETYSAFANTLGGLLLLGVEELRDKSLHAVDLPEPKKLVKEFWQKVNDPKIVSHNILTKSDIRIEMVEGKHIIVIDIPQAPLYLGPIYIEGDPVSGVFIRNGEGDYRCTKEECEAMFQKAEQRMKALKKQKMIEYLTDHVTGWFSELARVAGAEDDAEAQLLLDELVKEGTLAQEEVYAEGGDMRLKYRLKS